MGAFFKVLKEEKGMRFLFVIFAILLLMGIIYTIFAIYKAVS